jgi:5-methylcytosine-specific restriction endonuclease McrA
LIVGGELLDGVGGDTPVYGMDAGSSDWNGTYGVEMTLFSTGLRSSSTVPPPPPIDAELPEPEQGSGAASSVGGQPVNGHPDPPGDPAVHTVRASTSTCWGARLNRSSCRSLSSTRRRRRCATSSRPRQRGEGLSNCPLCAVSGNANQARTYQQTEMDADHVAAWSKGGATDLANCEMLCSTHNRAKGTASRLLALSAPRVACRRAGLPQPVACWTAARGSG